ncbi:APC family permease [Boudabousia marimammalium]|uniref:APC family permease n=1 Tax=Boudabousia marimammalium TaxID=156892 RepID=UPI000A01B827|nr:APC family permease [Boudabousia marimammalium]
MQNTLARFKRFIFGRPLQTVARDRSLLPKRIALPAFASGALSSVAYAPDEILLILSLAGFGATVYAPWVGLVVVAVLTVVIISYRQTVYAYPSGGGDYEVVSKNLGRKPALVVASALIVDYMLTVAVSVAAASRYLGIVFPLFANHKVLVAVSVVVLLTLLHMRGMRQTGRGAALPTYLFMLVIGSLAVAGLVKEAWGTLGIAPSATYDIIATDHFQGGLTGLAGAFLILRAFSSGCVALTGVETIANNVPSFRKPKAQNAAATLAVLGVVSGLLLFSVVHLASATKIRYVEDPSTQMQLHGAPVPEGTVVGPVIIQLTRVIFDANNIIIGIVGLVTALILVTAANSAVKGFPALISVLAKDGFLPRQFYTRGDKFSYSNGILLLTVPTVVLIVLMQASVTGLIQLYIIGVFLSFTLSQLGMIRHWDNALKTEIDADLRRRYRHSRRINMIGGILTTVVVAVVFIAKFTHGAWLAVLLMAAFFTLMLAISNHYTSVRAELDVPNLSAARVLPTRVHAVILVSKLDRPSMRAISYARATNPTSAEILSVVFDEEHVETLKAQWEKSGLPVPLTFVDAPYRDVTVPIMKHIRGWRRRNPGELVVVYLPEYLVQHWWQGLLHNHTVLRLKTTLLFTPGVVVAAVPWQLGNEHKATSLVRVVSEDPVDGDKSLGEKRGS